ncbi:hypothetical protein CEXT_559641 [Caerostris extrusa]|uniref:Uncharacterized protein n=1 Tax=Caerostris extrusa TaxID=172846 RepID=A0AAV4P5K9_CAEEX|nr:hypothetical protein CEXT_559641 [Caerostris extrusa]
MSKHSRQYGVDTQLSTLCKSRIQYRAGSQSHEFPMLSVIWKRWMQNAFTHSILNVALQARYWPAPILLSRQSRFITNADVQISENGNLEQDFFWRVMLMSVKA